MNTFPHSFSSFSRTLLASTCAGALLALSACGGGSDDPSPGPDPTQASALECDTPLEAHFAVKLQVSGARIGTQDTEYIYGEKVDFNGQTMRRNTERRTIAYSGPGNLAGLTGQEVIVDYFTWNAANSTMTLYGYGDSIIWSDSPQIHTEALIYDPPMDYRVWQLMPGQSMDTNYKGTKRIEGWDGKVTTEQVNIINRTTYHGQETVNVPAGSFTACKFTVVPVSGVAAEEAYTNIQWFAKGSGALIKEQFIEATDQTGSTTITNEATEIRQF